MSRRLLLVVACCLLASVTGRTADSNVALSTRIVGDGSRSLLVEVRGPAGQSVDEVRIELPRGSAEIAVVLTAPTGWTSVRDGQWLRIFGKAVSAPFRMRIDLFDATLAPQAHVRLRSQNRNLADETVAVSAMQAVSVVASTAGLVDVPGIVNPGESIELTVLNLARTPENGEWTVAGIPVILDAQNHLRLTVPTDQIPGSTLRITYFDVWGERLVDSVGTQDVMIRARDTSEDSAPRLTACAKYGFRGDSICVCGHFPESTWNSLKIDGQPAEVTSASRHVIRIRLVAALAPGPHTITGDPAAGFSPTDTAVIIVLVLHSSIDVDSLIRGQSTLIRLAVEGATEPVTLVVMNLTPHIVSTDENYEELAASIDANNPTERRVSGRSPGNFSIDVRFPGAPCPCMTGDYPSTTSQPAPVFVPRRVLATIAIAAPPAAMAAAQAIAAANGLAVDDVSPLPLANEALVVFEIVDGTGAIAKAQTLAAAPGVTLAQPDFVYDTSQGSISSPSPSLAYGPAMIGADVIRSFARGDGVRVAVIDTGIDSAHRRLKDKVAEYVDVTGAGWTPDAHGTLVAGIIAAEPGDTDAPSGVAPGSVLVGVKSCVALSPTQALAAARCWSSTLARGIDAAAAKKVRVMNLSVGGPADTLLKKMVDAATAKGIAMISAAGNDGPTGQPSYPAAFQNVIAVTAVDAAGRLYPQATRGSFVALAAPGVDILSTGPGGRNQLFSGTSAATAFASGAVALLLQQRTNLSVPQLRDLLKATARDLGEKGRDNQFGDGLLDVCRAMVQSSGRQAPCR